VKSGGIIRTNRIFINIVLQISSVELFQGLIQVLRAVYIEAILLDHSSRKALAKLDTHIFQESTLG
jgi:hypothetical protein